MAFNNHHQMPRARRENTEEYYQRRMNETAMAIVDGYDAVPSTRQVRPDRPVADTTRPRHSYRTESSSRQGGASYNVPASGDRHRGSVRQDSHTDRPGASNRSGESVSSQGGARFHPYSRPQQAVPPNVFSRFGDTYPTPPTAWLDGSDTPSQASRPRASRNYENASRSAPYALSNVPSPYAANAPIVNTYPRSQINAPPTGQRLQTHPHYRSSRRSPVQAVDDKVDDVEGPSEADYSGESGEEQELPTIKETKKSKMASKPKDQVRRGLTHMNAHGELEWLATVNSKGVLAVRHNDIRPQLIAMAEAERVALGVENEHPDEPGPGIYNVTSFYHEHVQWGPDREDRPEINFDWEEDREKNPRPEFPGYMYWEEDGLKYLVLDPHDNPVKDWDIPATIASNVPGYKLEAMRRQNMSLGHKDFWARMPSQINVGTEDHPVWEELGHPNSIVNMPMERFRFHAGLCSWTERKKTVEIKEGLKKLYGNKLQDNSVRAFGRDLTTKEIKEIKKGNDAVFPIKGDVAPVTRRTGKAQSRKRKHFIDDEEGPSSEEETLTQARSHKRPRHGRRGNGIVAEVDDLVMFEQPAIIIDEADPTRRYPRRSTRKDTKASRRNATMEEVSSERSADEEYEDTLAQRHNEGSSSESERLEAASRESSGETDDEATPASRVPFRRIPRPGEVGGKSKGPSRVMSTGEEDLSNEKRDYMQTAVPMNIEGKTYYATYEGLTSNEQAHGVDRSNTRSQGQGPGVVDAAFARNESNPPQPHPLDLMMSMPLFEESNIEDEDTPLQAHRKWVRDYLGDEEAEAFAPASKRVRESLGYEEEAYAPAPKRLRTERSVPPLPGSPTQGATGNVRPQVDQFSGTSPSSHAQSSQTGEPQLEAEWSQDLEQPLEDPDSQSVSYRAVAPRNEEEVRSLIDALLPTREVYFAWTGEPAPRTDRQQSYRVQFDTILDAFQDWWSAHYPTEPLPILAGVMHSGRSVDDWEPPVKDSIYYEAFIKGRRAPRGANGQIFDLPNWPGSSFEDASRKW